MDRVVYIIGAGFSAPLGIPVMGNFLSKSKDLYFKSPNDHPHFKQVFDTINKLAVAKNYYNCDLHNIEEILSIIEMNEFLEGGQLKDGFISYIKDVINFYTPPIKPISENLPGNWQDFLFGRDKSTALYSYFVASLMGLKFSRKKSNTLNPIRPYDDIAERDSRIAARYSVLSLNYDMVLENSATAIKEHYSSSDSIAFEKSKFDPSWNSTHLAKLHGCLSDNEIVPPTWAKGTHESIVPIWKNSHNLLTDANHIRFIGYSLPVADSYIKYLLKSSVIQAPHLKSIDVICLDPNGEAKARYDDFFEFTNYRFVDGSVTNYLEKLQSKTHSMWNRNEEFIATNSLEAAHHEFMETAQ
ncbi:SIR2 family protein [Microbulbifer sp. ANSA003]|uniref:SIR2 family protein n=1 Tax=Microbulbifer sp. ANSA003 TaxID=3243360 RepID=UPI004042D912